MFNKEREVDKLKHSIKFGKVSGALSTTFSTAGTSKLEMAAEQVKLLSEAQTNQLKWRENSTKLIRLNTRFMDAMRQLQKAVHHKKGDKISTEKH